MASRDLKIAAAVVFCFAVYTLFWTNLKDCKFSRVPQLTNLLDARQYDSVKIFLLFIGYNRSRHTLLASLLDAHPNIIVANDYNILGEWIKNPLLSQRSKYYMYELLYAKSRYDVILRNICNFLEITCTEKYLQDCAAIVDPVPSTTRTNVEWNTDQINRVRRLILQYPFLRRYSFYD
ncbi:uncharacterized protein LOC113684038 [Pocillopora damicornis]|uniref:uncharacterized protein LOC113684038 n=1 Tax=Pocillopora damicornis TaxID=46731 RepID=UPI000F554D9C|nr:uncharacterized protein LOC113684038 [Pocillopora damicornis]